MRYFHRTSVSVAEVLQEADTFFGARLETVASDGRARSFRGPTGAINIQVKPEGGHYTLVTAVTDQVAESEADKSVKRFLARVHRRHAPPYQLRGAY